MRSSVLRTWVVALACSPCISLSGELECGILNNCRIDGIVSSVKWKPSGSCSRPFAPPLYFGSSAREYNDAVDSFNRWLSGVDLYLSCVRNEATADMRKMPEIIVDGVKQVEEEMSRELARARSKLQMMRPQ